MRDPRLLFDFSHARPFRSNSGERSFPKWWYCTAVRSKLIRWWTSLLQTEDVFVRRNGYFDTESIIADFGTMPSKLFSAAHVPMSDRVYFDHAVVLNPSNDAEREPRLLGAAASLSADSLAVALVHGHASRRRFEHAYPFIRQMARHSRGRFQQVFPRLLGYLPEALSGWRRALSTGPDNPLHWFDHVLPQRRDGLIQAIETSRSNPSEKRVWGDRPNNPMLSTREGLRLKLLMSVDPASFCAAAEELPLPELYQSLFSYLGLWKEPEVLLALVRVAPLAFDRSANWTRHSSTIRISGIAQEYVDNLLVRLSHSNHPDECGNCVDSARGLRQDLERWLHRFAKTVLDRADGECLLFRLCERIPRLMRKSQYEKQTHFDFDYRQLAMPIFTKALAEYGLRANDAFDKYINIGPDGVKQDGTYLARSESLDSSPRALRPLIVCIHLLLLEQPLSELSSSWEQHQAHIRDSWAIFEARLRHQDPSVTTIVNKPDGQLPNQEPIMLLGALLAMHEMPGEAWEETWANLSTLRFRAVGQDKDAWSAAEPARLLVYVGLGCLLHMARAGGVPRAEVEHLWRRLFYAAKSLWLYGPYGPGRINRQGDHVLVARTFLYGTVAMREDFVQLAHEGLGEVESSPNVLAKALYLMYRGGMCIEKVAEVVPISWLKCKARCMAYAQRLRDEGHREEFGQFVELLAGAIGVDD